MSKQKKRNGAKRKLGLGILVSILAFTLGCSADDIMGPGDVSGPKEGPGDGFQILADPHGKDIDPIQAASYIKGSAALISADVGGVVTWNRFRLDIPAGALSEDTEIKISRPNPGLVLCELEPHGIQFNKPVTLQIDYSGTLAAGKETSMPSLGIYWYNEESGSWDVVSEQVDSRSGKMEAGLDHFSKYGGGWDGG